MSYTITVSDLNDTAKSIIQHCNSCEYFKLFLEMVDDKNVVGDIVYLFGFYCTKDCYPLRLNNKNYPCCGGV